MGVLDRVKSMVGAMFSAPEQPAKPKAYGYSSSYPYSGTGGGSKWQYGLSASGAGTYINHYETLQNARSAWHESPQARTLITRRRDITVDKGLALEPTPAWDVLGITDDEYKERWIADHEKRFDMYMSSKQCHRSGTMTGYQIQRLYSLFDGRDNDQFIRFYYSKDRSLVSPLQLEFIDPTQIKGCGFTDSLGFNDYYDGIKRDSAGKEISYLVWVKVKNGNYWKWEPKEIPARGARSGRIFMIHGYEQEYAGQGRGFSQLHFAIQNLENITDFTSSTIKKAINQADIIGFVKPGEDNPASNPWEDQQGGPRTPDIPIVITDSTGEEFVCVERDEYTKHQPGSDFIANLNRGEEIQFLEDTAPAPQFDAFVTSIMSYLASAYNMPIEVVLMKFNANYSASRAALLMAWQIGRIKQDDIKADLMDYVWEMWLSEEIAAGRTQAPGWSDPVLKQAWMQYKLQGSPLPSISPRDDLAAIGDKLKYGITTQEREARAINGSSAKQNAVINSKQFAETPVPPWEAPQVAPEESEQGESSEDNE